MLNAARINYQRASAFLADAQNASLADDKERYLASAVENAVAIVEKFLDQSSQHDQKVRELARSLLPRYRLLKRVRIHEFHRRPLPSFSGEFTSKVRIAYAQGPIKLSTGTSPNSAACVTFGRQGLETDVIGTGKANRKPTGSEKELSVIDGELVDEFSGDRIELEKAITQYLVKVPEFLEAVTKL